MTQSDGFENGLSPAMAEFQRLGEKLRGEIAEERAAMLGEIGAEREKLANELAGEKEALAGERAAFEAERVAWDSAHPKETEAEPVPPTEPAPAQ